MTITTAELLDALAAATAGEGPAGAKTVQEIAAENGVSVPVARKALHVLHAQRRLQVHTVTRQALDGRSARVPAYTVLPPAKPGKRRGEASF